MKIHEKCEIADLVAEILEKEENLHITAWDDMNQGSGQGSPQIVFRSRKITGPVLIEVLRATVDQIRKERGEPSRAEEFAAFVESDRRHGEAPPVEIGPGATCGCGFSYFLELKREMTGRVCWKTGKLIFPDQPCEQYPLPGEIGTCPDCGKSYTFGA